MDKEYQLSLTAEEIENKLKAADVQPDWDQKNSNEPDYIKNRPCYTTIVYDLSVDTPQDLKIVKLWDFTNGSNNFLNVFRRLLSSKNILRAPGELLEDGSSKQMYLIWIGMWMPPTYDDNKWLSGIYTCKSLSEKQITSIGGTNYKIKLTSMAYYFVFDTTTLDADHASLFSEVGIYVQPDDDWGGHLPLQGVLKLSVSFTLNDWFIPDTVARVKDVPTKTYVDTAVANMMKLVSPSGKIFQITVDDSGALSTTEIS